ncbi:hypothetical protein AAH476_16000, partial [Enterobacter cloacae subsp. cloacae]
RNRSHWSTSKTPSYTKSVSWQHHPLSLRFVIIHIENHTVIYIAFLPNGARLKGTHAKRR